MGASAKFWQAWCRRGRARGLDRAPVRAPGSDAHAEVERIFAERTREQWHEFAEGHDCCLEPVLDLDEALDSELVRAREMVVQVEQPGTDGVRLLGVPVKLSRTPGAPAGPGPALGEHTREVLTGLGLSGDEIDELGERARWREPGRPPEDEGAGRGQRCERRHDQAPPAGGLLGSGADVVKTSRNMAYYPPDYVERIKLIKQLQEALHAPQGDQVDARRRSRAGHWLVGSKDRILDRALAGDQARVTGAELRRRHDILQVLERLAELEVVTPNSVVTDRATWRSWRRSAASGPGATTSGSGFTVYDTLRYKRALESS